MEGGDNNNVDDKMLNVEEGPSMSQPSKAYLDKKALE